KSVSQSPRVSAQRLEIVSGKALAAGPTFLTPVIVRAARPRQETTMSRAYRIKVRESLSRVIRASDHVSTQLELLEILPQEAMAELLERELVSLGFERQGEVLVREQNGVIVEIDPKTGTVTARIEADQDV